MPKSRTHQFIINVTFDKPCTAAHALDQVRYDGGIDAGSAGGNHYCTTYEDHEPEIFRIRSIRRAKRKQP